MSSRSGEHDKGSRPPDVSFLRLSPPRPPPTPLPVPGPRHAGYLNYQQDDQTALPPSQRGRYPAGGGPIDIPLGLTSMGLPPLNLGKGRSAVAAASAECKEQTTASSPLKSDYGHVESDSHGFATRSKQSGRGQQSAMAAQAQHEARDTMTARGKIESRSERNYFKMTGQIPPTPTEGELDEDEIYIKTEDLRSQGQAASGPAQPNQDEPLKSPKKKLLYSLRKAFSKSTSTAAAPSMPSKAAQVLGTAARQPHALPVRYIQPTSPAQRRSAELARTATVKSLPDRITHPGRYGTQYHRSPPRHVRIVRRGSAGRGSPKKRSPDVEKKPLLSRAGALPGPVPPTPPAKDTPPKQRSGNTLRWAAPIDDVGQDYSPDVEQDTQFHFSNFSLPPPSSSSGVFHRSDGVSPPKFHPFMAEEYTQLLADEALSRPYPERTDSSKQPEGGQRSGHHDAPRLPRQERRRKESRSKAAKAGKPDNHSLLEPRFYTPKNLPARGFLEGETPSTNTNKSRLLYTFPSESPLHLHPQEDESTGFIDMMFQGDPRDIDPNSSTARELEASQRRAREKAMQSDTTATTTRAMQDLRINEQSDSMPQNEGRDHHHHHSPHHHPDPSSSRLTDARNAASTGFGESQGDFQPQCLSAVPSPLHKVPVPVSTARPMVPVNGPFGPFPRPFPHKSIDEHFFMTNEHLDVVGKTTWDLLEALNKQQKHMYQAKHDQVTNLFSGRLDELKLEWDGTKTRTQECVNRVDGCVTKQEQIHATLDTIKDSTKKDIPHLLAEQGAKLASIEAELKEIKQMIQALAKASEPKAAEDKTSQHQANTPNKGCAHGFGAHHGAGAELGHAHEHRSMTTPVDGPSEGRLGYQSGHQWAARAGYLGRNNKEDRPAYPTNPYHFAHGSAYNTGYSGNYSSFGYSPGSPEQHFPFHNHGQAK